ncbi:MAG: peptide-methionine (S)-S-oxide reductase MsrA [Bacteroidota bacterium]
MKRLLVPLLFIFCSCDDLQKNEPAPPKIPAGVKQTGAGQEAIADFSQGCFWHSEIVFQSLEGVNDAVSGYAGGTDPNPSYETVCSGAKGHAETVEVHYDPTKISFKTLVEAFFASQDPTTLNRQGNDEGTQYRSIAFYRTEAEKKIIKNEIKRLTDEKKFENKIVTEVVPFTRFYPAEDYHQEYILNNPWNGYVQNVSIPDFEKFKRTFKGNYK